MDTWRDADRRLLEIVATLGAIATEELDEDAAMQVIVNRVCPLIEADAAVIGFLQDGELVFRAGVGIDPRVSGWRFPLQGSLAGRSLEEGRVLVASDARHDSRVLREVCLRLRVGSLICAPLISQGAPIGVLAAYAHRTGSFERDEARALKLIVHALAAHLHRARQYSRILRLCKEDHLTGLGNRRNYESRLVTECAKAERYGSELALCLLDLDGFKQVNDRFGHTAGDQVLRAVGQGLLRVRTSDDAFRIGGDEFALLFGECGVAQARHATERLIGSMDFSGSAVDGMTFGVTLGVAAGTVDPVELHAAADRDLLRAKTCLYASSGARSASGSSIDVS